MIYEETIKWHEVVKRPLTGEEKEEYAENYYYIPKYMLDCPLPDDGQEILIATKWRVDTDICCYDDGYYLESNGDWDDVIAWAEMPKYKGGAKWKD